MKKFAVLLVILCPSCAYNCAKLFDPTTGAKVAQARTFTFFDSQSTLSKQRLTTVLSTNGQWSPGISTSGLNQESSSTNIADMIGTGVGMAVKAMAKP